MATDRDQRISDLEKKLDTFMTWVKVLSGIAVALGLTAGWLFQRAIVLGQNYETLKIQAEGLQKTIPTLAQNVLHEQFPVVFQTEMATLVHYNDHFVIKNHTTQRVFGSDDGINVLTAGPVSRGRGRDEVLDIEKIPAP